MRAIVIIPLVLSIAGISGCSRIPQNEIETTRRALEAAKAADADLFARESFAAAHRLFDSAAVMINSEQRKLPFASDYAPATEILNTAAATAKSAIRESRESRTLQHIITDSLITRAKTMVHDTKIGLSTTRRVGPAVRDSLRHVADSALSLSQHAAAAFAKDRIGAAAEEATAAITLMQPAWKLVAPKRDTTKSH